MNLAIKCGKCKQWGAMETSETRKAVYRCKVCGKARKLLDSRLEWNMHRCGIPEGYDIPKLIAKLNEGDNRKC